MRKKLEKVLADKGYDTRGIFNRLKKGSKVRGEGARDETVRKIWSEDCSSCREGEETIKADV